MLSTTFPNLKKSVFIVTYGRSGSTLLQNLLNSLPGYLIRGENENLISPLAEAWSIVKKSEQGNRMRTNGLITTSQNPWFGYEAVSEKILGEELASSFTNAVLRPNDDTRVIGFKEIRWHTDPELFTIIMSFLYRFFPKAQFIFNTRNHDEVVRSGWWKYMDEKKVRQQLIQAEDLYLNFAAANSNRCIALHYNNYIEDTNSWRSLFDFLAEPFDMEIVNKVLDIKLQHLKNY